LVSNIYLTNLNGMQETNLIPLEEYKIFISCGRSNVTPTMATRGAPIGMAGVAQEADITSMFAEPPTGNTLDLDSVPSDV
jgi:hypothetical protein